MSLFRWFLGSDKFGKPGYNGKALKERLMIQLTAWSLIVNPVPQFPCLSRLSTGPKSSLLALIFCVCKFLVSSWTKLRPPPPFRAYPPPLFLHSVDFTPSSPALSKLRPTQSGQVAPCSFPAEFEEHGLASDDTCLKMLIAIPASRKSRAPGLPEHLLNEVFHPETGSWSFSGTLLTLINRGQTFSSFHLCLLVMHARSCAHAPAHRNFVGSAISSPAMVGIAYLHHSANEHTGKMDS